MPSSPLPIILSAFLLRVAEALEPVAAALWARGRVHGVQLVSESQGRHVHIPHIWKKKTSDGATTPQHSLIEEQLEL